MAVTSDNDFSVTINSKGTNTGKVWPGTFEVKIRLSMADYIAMDRMRRELLGPVAPEYASPRAANIAEIFSELSVRIVKRPPEWWTESRNGLDLEDDEPARDLYDAIKVKLTAISEAQTAKAEAARKELAASVKDAPSA